jgi:DNA-binding CsgD family transcriptional regulator
MYALSNQDYKDILDIVYLCNSHLANRELHNDILRALRRMFNTNGEIFFPGTKDLKSIALTNFVSLDLDDYYNALYAQHYWRFDPHLQRALHSRSIAFKSDDIVAPSQWLRLDYYNEFFRPQNKKHELSICLRSSSKLFGMLCLLRSGRQRNFHELDIIKAKILAPHLTNALRNSLLLSEIDEELKMLRAGMKSLSQGVVLLDYELRPIYFNSEAKRICLYLSRQSQESTDQNGYKSGELSLAFEIVEDCLSLKELLRSGNNIAPLQRQRIISAECSNTFCIECSVAWQHSDISSIPYFVVSLEDITKAYKINQEIIQKKYHLTDREVDITCCTADGLTNKEIAESLFISKFTVETHLRNIYEKTGAKNRTELASIISPAQKMKSLYKRGHFLS